MSVAITQRYTIIILYKTYDYYYYYYCSTERTRDGETVSSGGRDTKAVREHLTGRLFSTRQTRIVIIITLLLLLLLCATKAAPLRFCSG